MNTNTQKTNMYNRLCAIPSDISEHFPTLRDLAMECNHVTEMGVRACVSTWAFLEGLKKGGSLVSIDMLHPSYYGGDLGRVENYAKEKGIDFKFVNGNTLFIDIEETDLLFIDTLHENGQLLKELSRHASKARKYIVLHDTVSCRSELWPVVEWFVKQGEWKIKKEYTNNNGLLVLSRI